VIEIRRCPGCQRSLQVVTTEGEGNACKLAGNANVRKCLWRRLQAELHGGQPKEDGPADGQRVESPVEAPVEAPVASPVDSPATPPETVEREEAEPFVEATTDEPAQTPAEPEPSEETDDFIEPETDTRAQPERRAEHRAERGQSGDSVEAARREEDKDSVEPLLRPTFEDHETTTERPPDEVPPSGHGEVVRAFENKVEALNGVIRAHEATIESLHAKVSQHEETLKANLHDSSIVQRALREAEVAKAALKRELEGLGAAFGDTKQQNADLRGRHDTLQAEHDKLKSQLSQAASEIQSARTTVEQRVTDLMRNRTMKLAGMGLMAGMLMGLGGGWLLHPARHAADRTSVPMAELNDCLNHADWNCVDSAASAVLAIDASNAAALAARQEAQLAIRLVEQSRALRAREAHVAQAQQAAQAAEQAAQAAQANAARAANAAHCPSAPAAAVVNPQAATGEAVQSAIEQQRKATAKALVGAADAQIGKGGYDCAIDLATLAARYDSDTAPLAKSIVGKAQVLKQKALSGVRIENYRQ
jgi:hypothetical protein